MLLVAAGGAAGSVLRYLVGIGAVRWLGPAFPHGTLAINVIGSALMGVLVAVLARRVDGAAAADLRLLLATGFLGGFTTFSTFSLDVGVMIERGALGPASAYVALSLVGGVGALFLGLWLARHLA